MGVHQDGLVHISAMANTYVSDPRKIATPGDVVRVKVLEVDPKRRRISLTMRLDDAPGDRATATRLILWCFSCPITGNERAEGLFP